MKKNVLLMGVCAIASLFTTKLNAQVPDANFSISQNTVCVGSTVQLTDLSTYTPTAWSYTVDGVGVFTSANPTLSFASSGLFNITLVATNLDGDSSPLSQTISVNPLPTVLAGTDLAVCAGELVTFNASGASSYTWTSGVTDGVAFTPLATTVYTVTGEDVNGCINFASKSVTVNALPVLSILSNTSICLGESITQTVSGASSYTWDTGSNSNVLIDSPTSNMNYSVTGLDAVTGCSNTVSNFITVYNLPSVSVNSGAVCTGQNFVLIPNGASTYVFSGGSNSVSPAANTSYTVTGTDVNGCVASAVSDVTVLALPLISINSASICSGSSFTLIPSGANTYTFSNGSNVVSPLTTTSYSVSGTDNNGCVSSAMAVAEITVIASPVITVNTGSICAGDTFTMNPSGASTYTYSNGTNIVNPTSTTSYTITGSDLNGCVSNNAVASITVFALPVVSVNSGTLCSGSVFTLNPTGANAYVFSNGSATVNPLVNTSYSVTGISLQGCNSANTAVADLTVIALPVVAVNSGTICSGNSFTLVPSGASNYVISGGVAVVSPLSNTSYSITGSNAFGCVSSNTAIALITVNSLPVLNITGNSTICAGQWAVLNASGASTYLWSNTTAATSVTISPATTSSIAVIGTDLNGCVSALIQTVVVNQLPVLSVNGPTAICAGQTASLLVSGASTYTWNGTVNASSLVVSPTANSSYTISATDLNACNANLVYALVVNALPSLTLANASICPGNSYTLNPTGAVSYTYSNGSAVITPVSTSTYNVIGVDANGCTSMITATISVVNTVTLTVSGATTICNGQTTNLNANGATTYSWSTNATTSTLAVNPSTTSTYTLTGNTGNCTNKTVVTVSVNALPVISVSSSQAQICAGESATLTGNGATSYSWTSGATTNYLVVNPSVTSTYTVIGTDANSCSNSANFTQNVNACTGIAKVNAALAAVQIYPNPFQSEFTIQLSEQATVNVVNALGQIVYQADLNAGNTSIDLSSQITGLYFVQIKQGSDIKTLKVIKN